MVPRLASREDNLTVNDWILNIATLLYVASLLGVAPYLSRYAVALGASQSEVSLLATSYALTAIMLRLIVGYLNDKGYAKHLMVLGGLLNSIAVLVYIEASSVSTIYIGRLIQGVSVAFFIPASLYSASLGDPRRASRTILWRSTMWGLGSALGPALLGFILDRLSWTAMFSVSAILSISSAILSQSYKQSKIESKKSYALDSILTLPFIVASLTLFIYVVSYQSLSLFLPALHEVSGYPAYETTVFFTILATANLLARLTLSISRSFTPIATAIIGLILSIIGYISVAIDPLSNTTILYAILIGGGLGILFPSLQVISLLGVPEARRGLASSIYTAMWDLASLIGPPLVMTISAGYKDSLMTSAVIVCLAIIPIATFTILRK
ncbi:MAG: MFS transporter [Acidilobaceae archaeon]